MDASGATPGNPASMTARGPSHHCRSGAGSFSKQVMAIGDARAANRTLVTISRRSGCGSTPRKSLFIRQFRRYLTWSYTFSSRSAHAAVSGASAEDTARAVVAIVAGNVVEI